LHLAVNNDSDARAVLYLTGIADTVARYQRAVQRAPPAVRAELQAEFDRVKEAGETAAHTLDSLPDDDAGRQRALAAGVERVEKMVDGVARQGWTGWGG
jgi:hypothetical protein